MLKRFEKQICLISVIVMFFVGVCLGMPQADSSFLCTDNVELSPNAFEAENYVVEIDSAFTLDMIHNGTSVICRGLENSTMKWRGSVVLLFCIVGMFLQYQFYYQSSECKEDGQLLLCRSIAVKYIHQKDGEK